jgi:hypothetical protein
LRRFTRPLHSPRPCSSSSHVPNLSRAPGEPPAPSLIFLLPLLPFHCPLPHLRCLRPLFRRIIFDFEKLDRVKVTDSFEFPLVLDMAPFLESGEMDHLRGTSSDAVATGVAVASGACWCVLWFRMFIQGLWWGGGDETIVGQVVPANVEPSLVTLSPPPPAYALVLVP